MKNITLIALTSSLIFTQCGIKKQDEVVGLYVSRNNLNTIDTVWVHEDGSYINVMYRKNDNSLIYKNTGKWEAANNYITFHNFFADEDEIHSKEVTNYEDVLMTSKLQLERKAGKIIIHHKDMHDDVYLEKVE